VVQLTQTETVEGDLLEHGESPFATTVAMKTGTVYQMTFEGQAGETVDATATGAEGATVDPLIGILDAAGKPLIFNDDLIPEEDQNSRIAEYILPADGVYTLVVGQAGGSSEGEINVTLIMEAE
jgi:hypothetical protein